MLKKMVVAGVSAESALRAFMSLCDSLSVNDVGESWAWDATLVRLYVRTPDRVELAPDWMVTSDGTNVERRTVSVKESINVSFAMSSSNSLSSGLVLSATNFDAL